MLEKSLWAVKLTTMPLSTKTELASPILGIRQAPSDIDVGSIARMAQPFSGKAQFQYSAVLGP
jgi:hypothetical protein